MHFLGFHRPLLTLQLSPCPGLLALALKDASLFRGWAESRQAWEQRVAQAWAPSELCQPQVIHVLSGPPCLFGAGGELRGLAVLGVGVVAMQGLRVPHWAQPWSLAASSWPEAPGWLAFPTGPCQHPDSLAEVVDIGIPSSSDQAGTWPLPPALPLLVSPPASSWAKLPRRPSG